MKHTAHDRQGQPIKVGDKLTGLWGFGLGRVGELNAMVTDVDGTMVRAQQDGQVLTMYCEWNFDLSKPVLSKMYYECQCYAEIHAG